MNNGAFDDRILLGTFLTVEVEKKRFKDCIHLALIPRKIQELILAGTILFWQKPFVKQLTNVDNEPVEAIIPIKTDIFEYRAVKRNDTYLRETKKGAAQILADIHVQFLIAQQAIHRSVHNLIEKDIACQFIECADGFPFPVPIMFERLIQF